MSSSWPIIIEAGAIQDAAGCFARPGLLAVDSAGCVAYAGRPDGLPAAIAALGWRRAGLPQCLLVPGMVNAHVHLDLTPMGPQPYGGAFIPWLGSVVAARQTMRADTGDAWRQCRDAGVCAVGDIVGQGSLARALARMNDAGLGGVAFGELFGLGSPYHAEALARVAGEVPTSGWQPHAPYSAGPEVYAAAIHSGLPVCTHLAETEEEATFVATGGGPFRALLERLGRWHPSFLAQYDQGLSPVAWMAPFFALNSPAPLLMVHVNYASDADLNLLAKYGVSVAYCPVASDYFGHRGHRYREMLELGIPVCLGTDSIVCQPAGESQPLGILPQMRHLFRRDGTDPALLLQMATIHGAKALGLSPAAWPVFHAGARVMAGALLFDPALRADPLRQALQRDEPLVTLDSLL